MPPSTTPGNDVGRLLGPAGEVFGAHVVEEFAECLDLLFLFVLFEDHARLVHHRLAGEDRYRLAVADRKRDAAFGRPNFIDRFPAVLFAPGNSL